jgi:hypothetical protein
MEARLSGLGFKIEAITPERQAVSPRDITEWKWEIDPTESGLQKLHLSLSAIFYDKDREMIRTVRTFDKTIEVEVTLGHRLSDFVSRNWQWLWKAILVPLGAWAISQWIKRKREGWRD